MMQQIGYMVLSLIMATVLILIYAKALRKSGLGHLDVRRKVWVAGAILLLWFIYIYLISSTGIIQDLNMPPKLPLLLVIPAFVVVGILTTRLYKTGVLKYIPLSWLILYQSFRILIESLFIVSVETRILHPEVTFEGYNYDMLFGFSALIVGYLHFKKKLSIKGILYWNYFGLLLIAFIIFLFTTTLYFPQFWGSDQIIVSTEFLTFPYTLVPPFLMPSAVFIHILSILKLSEIAKGY